MATVEKDFRVKNGLIVAENATLGGKTITVASGSADATAANGAGLSIDGANATLTYTSGDDTWTFNKSLEVTGDVDATAYSISGTPITATASELNLLDGATVTTAELNYLDGVTSPIQGQLNVKVEGLSDLGVTSTASELNLLDGATVTTAEINKLAGTADLVEQTDIGSAPNQIPLNQDLGNLAYQDSSSIAGDVGVGGNLSYVGTLTGSTSVINIGSGQVFKDASGNVGLGSAPFQYSAPLTITPLVQLNTTSATQLGVSRFTDNTGAPAFVFLKSRGTAIDSYDIVNNNDPLGSFLWLASNGTTGVRAAEIRAVVDGTPSSTSMPGRIDFSTVPSGSTTSETRMSITSAGVVSINSGYVKLNGNQIGGIQVTIADDAFAEITPPRRGAGFVAVTTGGEAAFPDSPTAGIAYADWGNSPSVTMVHNNSSFAISSGGPPTGTTGTDDRATLFAGGTSGKLYLENRRGGTRVFEITFT